MGSCNLYTAQHLEDGHNAVCMKIRGFSGSSCHLNREIYFLKNQTNNPEYPAEVQILCMLRARIILCMMDSASREVYCTFIGIYTSM